MADEVTAAIIIAVGAVGAAVASAELRGGAEEPQFLIPITGGLEGLTDLLNEQSKFMQDSIRGIAGPLSDAVQQQDVILRATLDLFSRFVQPDVDRLAFAAEGFANSVVPTFGTLSDALLRIVAALIKGEEIPADSLLAVLREVLVTVRRVGGKEGAAIIGPVTAILATTLPRILGQRRKLLDELGFVEGEEVSSLGLAAAPPEFREAVEGSRAIEKWIQSALLAAVSIVRPLLRAIADALRDASPAMQEMGAATAGLTGDALELLHLPMESVLRTAADHIFNRIDAQLAQFDPTTPDNVIDRASKMIGVAGGLGMTAHLAAVVAEVFHPLKHLGFPQVAAVLGDLAGFQGIAHNTIGQQIEVMLRTPMRRQALERFRPELPDPRMFDQIFLERLVSEPEARDYWRQHGLTEQAITQHLEEVYREISPRQLVLAFADAGVDEAWALRMLQRYGLNDEDAGIVLDGIRVQANKAQRQSLMAETEAAYVEGLIDLDGADSYLSVLNLREDALSLWATQASLHRFRGEQSKRRAILEDQAAVNGITLDTLRAELAALGYDARAQEQSVRLVSARLNLESFQDEHRDLKDQIRRMQADQITKAQELYRRFQLDEDQLAALLRGVGVIEDRIPSIVELAQVRRTPVPKLAEVLSPDRQAQVALKKRADQILTLQRAGLLDEASSILLQTALGVDEQAARLEAGIVAARRIRPTLTAADVQARAQERERQRASTAKAREATRQEADAQRAAEREIQLELRAREDAALALFRKGELTSDALALTLKGLGRSTDLADAIVAREVARHAAARPSAG